MRRGLALSLPALMTVLLAACASGDRVADAGLSRGTAPQPPLEGFLQQAQSATQQGQQDKARRTLREAAMAYPASKEPWLRLTEDYFRQGDYGNAILAAQEVTQRDARNAMAQSVLAVSGLRVSAQALGELRDRSSFEVGSKDEAVELTRQMRTHLGEPVLVPVRHDAPSDAARVNAAAPRARPAPATAAASASPVTTVKPVAATTPPRSAAPKTASVRAAAVAAASAPAPAAKGGNPFKVLD